ncbi:MAG: hypothetical protein L0H96_24715 [Humibacillus sp.]|nr:hypothetical protein [Humibacillus sp.]MDN5780086.1 hypothetical protein [Humibacillus sp.]
MNVNEAKATSRLLHGLAGDTDLDPATAAAVIETLSFQAGAALEVTRVLRPASLQMAVETATIHTRPARLSEGDASGGHEPATASTTRSGAWRLLAGALIAVMATLMGTASIIDNGWLLLSGPLLGLGAVLASRRADRELLRLLRAVEGHARSTTLQSEPALALDQPALVNDESAAGGSR